MHSNCATPKLAGGLQVHTAGLHLSDMHKCYEKSMCFLQYQIACTGSSAMLIAVHSQQQYCGWHAVLAVHSNGADDARCHRAKCIVS